MSPHAGAHPPGTPPVRGPGFTHSFVAFGSPPSSTTTLVIARHLHPECYPTQCCPAPATARRQVPYSLRRAVEPAARTPTRSCPSGAAGDDGLGTGPPDLPSAGGCGLVALLGGNASVEVILPSTTTLEGPPPGGSPIPLGIYRPAAANGSRATASCPPLTAYFTSAEMALRVRRRAGGRCR